MRVDLLFYAIFWLFVSTTVLTPIYIVSWAALKKLSPCTQVHHPCQKCSKCNNLGFIWPWEDTNGTQDIQKDR